MKIESEANFVEVECEESDLYSVALSIQIYSNEFRGFANWVRFGTAEVQKFLTQLKMLDQKRQGTAQLVALSGINELGGSHLKIFSIDKLGHLAVVAEVQRLIFLNNSQAPFVNKTSITFEIEPDSLLTILKDFRELFSPVLK